MPIRGGGAYRQHTTYKQAILARDGHRCTHCGCGVGDVCDLHYAPVSQLDVAHIIPWPQGTSTPDNQRTLCHPCNKRQGTRTAPVQVPVFAP